MKILAVGLVFALSVATFDLFSEEAYDEPESATYDFSSEKDVCLLNDRLEEEPNVSAHCPLQKRIEQQRGTRSSCIITLRPSRIRNKRCGTCQWRGHAEPLCRPTETPDSRHCCCRKPMCNKKLLEDAQLGWGFDQCRQNNSCPHCLAGDFNVSRDPQWKFPSFPPGENCANKAPFCQIQYNSFKDSLRWLKMGCAPKHSKTPKNSTKLCPLNKNHPRYNIPCRKEGNVTTCCCHGIGCNGLFYHRNVFDLLMNMRGKEEQEYQQLLTSSRMPRKLWIDSPAYYNRQVILHFVLITVTVLGLIAAFALFRCRSPIDLDKMPAPQRLSVEFG